MTPVAGLIASPVGRFVGRVGEGRGGVGVCGDNLQRRMAVPVTDSWVPGLVTVTVFATVSSNVAVPTAGVASESVAVTVIS